jgi:hypothetical protein
MPAALPARAGISKPGDGNSFSIPVFAKNRKM